MQYTLWHNNNIDLAKWLASNTSLSGVLPNMKNIPGPQSAEFTRVPDEIKGILYLDAPDIIASVNLNGREIPFFTAEFSDHTPQGQHPKQRFSRLIASAEKGVPNAFILPPRKGTYTRSKDCFYALVKLMDIQQIPCFIYDWAEKGGTLLTDPTHQSAPPASDSEMKKLFELFELCKEYAHAERPLSHLMSTPTAQERIDFMRKNAYESQPQANQYGTVQIVATQKLPSVISSVCKINGSPYQLKLSNLPDYFVGRDETLIFSPVGKDPFRFGHGGDPYTGMMGFFDYCFCRYGKTTRERRRNLVYNPRKTSQDSFKERLA